MHACEMSYDQEDVDVIIYKNHLYSLRSKYKILFCVVLHLTTTICFKSEHRHITLTGHTGKEYIMAFPENVGSISYAQVLITTMTDTTVTIESPHPGVNRVINITAARGVTVNLPTTLMLKGNAIEQKGVLLRSPVDIAVYVFSQYSSTKGEAHTAIPGTQAR